MKDCAPSIARIIETSRDINLHELSRILSAANPGEHDHQKKKWKAECDRQLREEEIRRNTKTQYSNEKK